jgi:DNA helicase-2/ATP-dependent DNA helicase PcrA
MQCLAVLRKKPGLARAIACRFPIIIADEHQDASIHQHEILLELVRAGARLRLFGDALQAILTFDPYIPGWSTLIGDTPTFVVSGLWRWHANPDLGRWLASARECLIRGVPIPLGGLPECVHVVRAVGPTRTTWHQHPDVRSAIANLEQDDGVVVAVRSNADASQLAADTDLRLLVYEGANPPQIDQLIEAVVGADGDAGNILDALIDFAGGVGTLLPGLAGALQECFHAGGQHDRPEVSAVVQHIKSDPLVSGCMSALREMYDHRIGLGWNVSRAASVSALRQLPRIGLSSENIRDLIYQARRSNEDDVAPPRCVSTIHKIKGREVKHVLIPFLDSRTFASRAADRHLLYVAMSRSMETLTLVVPESSPSPLLEEF